MAKRREFNVFSLSFLDIMSCGFGAVILIFILIHHSTQVTSKEINVDMMSEAKKLEVAVDEDKQNLVQLKNTLNETQDDIVTTDNTIIQVTKRIEELKTKISELTSKGTNQEQTIEELKKEIKRLQEEATRLKGSVAGAEETGESLRSFVGEGDRQYLTGMKIGGRHILILLDASASMLDRTIVNVVRRRNLPDNEKLESPKWQRAIRTVEWIVANMPPKADFQLYTFNTEADPAIAGTNNKWLAAIDRKNTDTALANLKKVIPHGGTSLHYPFAVARQIDPRPDNIFLITDSLPTEGLEAPKKSAISGPERVKIFGDSLDELPPNRDIPINVILFPMEGDPLASPSFWRLAQMTGGSFLSPPKDWP